MEDFMIKSALAGFGFFILCGPAFADEAALKAQAADLTARYAKELKTALSGAIEKDGPMGALDVCHSVAPKIAADLSASSGWSVARTSLKPRNAASAPDDYERNMMESFNARIAKGAKTADLVSAEIVEAQGAKVFRFIKAIPTGEVCLTCHGENVSPELKQKISQLYPNDQATGFKIGDMRGVFTLKKPLRASMH
jgi:cytochrome c551/c552